MSIVAALLGGLSLLAGAETPELTWRAPPECPSQEEVLALVREMTPLEFSRELTVEAAVSQRADAEWALSLAWRLGDQRGSRDLCAGSCVELAKATALILVLLLRERLPVRRLSVDDEPDTSPPEPGSGAPPSLSASLALMTDLGLRPRPGVGGAVSLVGRYRITGLGVSILVMPEQRAELVEGRSAGARFSLLGFGLGGLLRVFEADSWSAEALTTALLATMKARPFGLEGGEEPRPTYVPSIALGARLLWHRGAFTAYAEAQGVVPTIRPRFMVEGLGVMHRPSALAGLVSAGIGWSLLP